MAFINICGILANLVILVQGENAYELYSIGYSLEIEGKTKEAIAYYEKALSLDPTAPDIYISLANALYEINEIDQGIEIGLKGLSVAPTNAQMLIAVGTGYIGKGDLKKGIQYYEKALETEPQRIEIYEAISILYEAHGRLKQAMSILDTMPDSLKTASIYVRMATLASKLNDHESAIRYNKLAFAADTTNYPALVGIGTGFDNLNMPDSAIFYFEQAVQKDRALSIGIEKRLVELYADVEQYDKLVERSMRLLEHDYYDSYTRRNQAFALHKMGKEQQALDQFLISAGIDPRDSYSRFYASRIYLEQGKYDAAQNAINDAIRIDPDFVELWIYLGFIAIDKKDFVLADYAFAEAAHRGGDLVQVYYLLGAVAEMRENDVNAYIYYHKALTLSPDDLPSLEALAHLCERIDRENEALATFHKIIALDTTNAVALNYVGYLYAERNDSLEYALGLINKAIAFEDTNGYYIDSRGWVYYQMGKYEEALIELKRASELASDAAIFEHLGDVYRELNESEKAKKAYEKALDLDPKSKAVKEKLLQIEGD